MSAPPGEAPTPRGSPALAALRSFERADAVDLALRCSLLVFALNPGLRWSQRVPVLALAVLGLLVPDLARRPWLWASLAGLGVARVVASFPLSDNHEFLMMFWAACVAVALATRDPRRALRAGARGMLGLAFLLATLWKVGLSDDFMDGTFFRVSLLADARFESVARLAGADDALFDRNEAVLGALDLAEPGGARLYDTPSLALAARAATLWTALLEGAIALLFLWPAGRVPDPGRVRDAALLAFCATTYVVAPVAGFGWLLVAMGLAQCEPGRAPWRTLYLLAFLAILVNANVPWLRELGRLASGTTCP